MDPVNTYRHHSWRSAAQVGEYPVHIAWNLTQSKNRAVQVCGYIAGYVAVPIQVALTPVTMVSDMVIGCAEALWMSCRGASGQEIKQVLYAKIIVSPIQQLVVAAVRIPFFLVGLWFLGCPQAQGFVFAMSDSFNHKVINIFIQSGIDFTDYQENIKKLYVAIEEEVQTEQACKKGLDKQEEYLERQYMQHGPSSEENHAKWWDLGAAYSKKYKVIKELVSLENNPNEPEEYREFKHRLFRKRTIYEYFFKKPSLGFKKFREHLDLVNEKKHPGTLEFLGLSEADYQITGEISQNSKILTRQLRRIQLMVHPDKFDQNDQRLLDEAQALFKCATAAKEFLEFEVW